MPESIFCNVCDKFIKPGHYNISWNKHVLSARHLSLENKEKKGKEPKPFPFSGGYPYHL